MKSICFTICVFTVVTSVCLPQAKPNEPREAQDAAADPMRGKAPGDVRDDNGLKLKLVWCPPGFVTMEQVEETDDPAATKADGSDDKPGPKTTPVKVFVTRGYWLGKYEVTQSAWNEVMATEPWKGEDFTEEGGDFPATHVSWNDAMEFCRKLTERERKAGRVPKAWEYTLPTEAQWELACRARTESRFSFGNDELMLGEYAWFDANAEKRGEKYAHRVGQKKPNPWGLYDMHGNVGEWCRDWFSHRLPGGRDPEVSEKCSVPVRVYRVSRTNQGRRTYELVETKEGSFRVTRGGSWGDMATNNQSAIRGRFDPSLRNNYLLGFRLALSPSEKK